MTAARGLSRAGSWIQASGAMVTVTIETRQLHSASLWGFVGVCHELEPIEKGTLKWVESEARAKSHFGAHPTPPRFSIFITYHFSSPPPFYVLCSLGCRSCWMPLCLLYWVRAAYFQLLPFYLSTSFLQVQDADHRHTDEQDLWPHETPHLCWKDTSV